MKLEEINRSFEEEQTQIQEEEVQKEQKHFKKKWVLLVAVVLLLTAAAIAVHQRTKGEALPKEEEIENVEGQITMGVPEGMKEGALGDALQKQIDESMFTVNVNSQPIFRNGSSKGIIDIVNSPGNPYACKVVLNLDEDGTELYRCDDLLYPDQYIHEIKLDKELDKGAYPATLTYILYDQETEAEVGLTKAGVTVVIQN